MAKDRQKWIGDRIMMKYYRLSMIILLTACQKDINVPLPNNTENIASTSQITNEALEKHNQLRKRHFQNGNLSYSLQLEADAQEYANELAREGTFKHDPSNLSNKYGENLYRYSGSTKPDLNLIIQRWYDEKKYYKHNTRECERGQMCGHYTQIVWKDSKLLGCASAQYTRGSFKGGYVTLCKYYPYGNIIGRDPY